MPQPYYTPKEAREVLGMTHSALLNQVTAGNLHRIIPPGRRQGVYLKEEVDELKREMDIWLLSRQSSTKAPAQFVKATVDDMPEAVALSEAVFGGYNTIPLDKRIEWLRKNPDIDYLLKQEGQIVGYLSLVPLSPATVDDLLQQRRFAKDLTANDILPYIPGTSVDIYGMAIGVRPGTSLSQKRQWGADLIIGLRSVLRSLGERGIIIRSFRAHSSKPDGIRLMRHMGLTETVASAPGMRDFVLDVEQSGSPFVLDYREALAHWQTSQNRTPANPHEVNRRNHHEARKPSASRQDGTARRTDAPMEHDVPDGEVRPDAAADRRAPATRHARE